MRMGQGVRTGLGHGGITCVLQTLFSSFLFMSRKTLITSCLFPELKSTLKLGECGLLLKEGKCSFSKHFPKTKVCIDRFLIGIPALKVPMTC